MRTEIKNTRNEIVGYIENNTYFTQRDKLKSEIFLRKQTFNDKFFETPVAIDKAILERLLRQKINKTRMLIINLENKSFLVEFDNEEFLREGVEINYDKRNKFGENYTKFSTQIVFDIAKGVRLYPEKEKLTHYIK